MTKEKIKLKKWDITDHLKTEKDIIEFLEAVFDDSDADYIPRALLPARVVWLRLPVTLA
jgi:DNA-binding phage protein